MYLDIAAQEILCMLIFCILAEILKIVTFFLTPNFNCSQDPHRTRAAPAQGLRNRGVSLAWSVTEIAKQIFRELPAYRLRCL